MQALIPARERAPVKILSAPWVRIASSVLSARSILKGNMLLAESTLEAMRTQVFLPRREN